MTKIPITKYITINAPNEAAKLCNEYGLKPVTIKQIYMCMNELLRQGGDEALKEFASIHPDRDLILGNHEKQQVIEYSSATGKNADGMSFSCEKTSNVTGEQSAGFTFDLKKQLPFILITAGALTGLIILVKSVS